MMDAFQVVLNASRKTDGVAGWPGRAGKCIRTFRRKDAAAPGSEPLAAVGPDGFLRDDMFVCRIGVGAEEQIGVIVAGEEENVIGCLGRDENGADPLSITAALAGRHF